MLEIQGISREIIENATIIFGRAQYVVKPDEKGDMVDRIWLFPLFSNSWACMKPFERFEDEEIDIEPVEEQIKRAMAESGEQLLGFAYVESYWSDNPNCQIYFGFFDREKRMATRMVVYTSKIKDAEAWQLFPDFTKRHMYDEPFESVSQELQEMVTELVGCD